MDQRPVFPFGSVMVMLWCCLLVRPAVGQAPLDLWGPDVLERIRDQTTLDARIMPGGGHWEVSFDSEIGDAKWADSEAPYEVHTGDTIRIHGFLAAPAGEGPYPALVIGHGHGGQGSADLARAVAAFGYVALSISGPEAGLSTGGPRDTEQAWISVEESVNEPSPAVSYLYHYAYAGMRGLTFLESLADLPGNPFRIAPGKLGVIGASMGGQFTYYINGVDDRVRAAVAVAVAGDWRHEMFYEGAWLYHGLYYYTRDGLRSGQDSLNTIADLCTDPTAKTFLDYFDPIQYAPTQHGPLLTIIGTHDQYFTIPGINVTYDRVGSAGTNPRFIKRILLSPNNKHGVVDSDPTLASLIRVLGSATRWLRYAFDGSPVPPETPEPGMGVAGGLMVFVVPAAPGDTPVRRVRLYFASQLDTTLPEVCDFASVPLLRLGDVYVGAVRTGTVPPCGPPVTPDNILYFASAADWAGFTVSSKIHYGAQELSFCGDFTPMIEHFPKDDFPVPSPPDSECACTAAAGRVRR